MYRILICDDERDIVSALKIYLSGEDYEIYYRLLRERSPGAGCAAGTSS